MTVGVYLQTFSPLASIKGSTVSQGMFVNCVYLYKLNELGLVNEEMRSWIDELQTQLKKVFVTRARVIAKSNKRFSMEANAPGYLSLSIGDFRMYFPYFIVDDLPDDAVLAELVEIAKEVKSRDYSTVCLSGSALYFGTLSCLGDLDFLEYSNLPGSTFNDKSRKKTELVDNIDDRFITFLSSTEFYGYIEVTNKVADIDYRNTGYPTSEESSPLQEAPLFDTPRELENPINLGEYLWRLATDARKLSINKPEKVAKRLLPLTRLLGIKRVADFILDTHDIARYTDVLNITQKRDLRRKLQDLDYSDIEALEKAIHNQAMQIRCDGSLSADVVDPLLLLAEEKSLLKNYGATMRTAVEMVDREIEAILA